MSKVLGENALVKIVNWAKETFAAKGEIGGSSGIPSGCICIWSGSTPPEGWALCDGQNGTPDLRGRFVLGYSSAHAIGSKGGKEKHTLSVNELAAHSHNFSIHYATSAASSNRKYSVGGTSAANEYTESRTSGSILTNLGGTIANQNQPFNIMPPYYTLAYIMKL